MCLWMADRQFPHGLMITHHFKNQDDARAQKCVCRGCLAVQMSHWLQQQPCQTPCSCQSLLAGEWECASIFTGWHTWLCAQVFTCTSSFRSTLFIFLEITDKCVEIHFSQAPEILSAVSQMCQICREQSCCFLISWTPPWNCTGTNSQSFLPSEEIHTDKCIENGQLAVFLFVLCHIPAGLLEEVEDCGWE